MRIGGQRVGFTMLDLMIVIVILGILAAVTIPIVTGHLTLAQNSSAKATQSSVRKALDMYFQRHATWPPTIEASLFVPPEPVTMPRGYQLEYDPASRASLICWTVAAGGSRYGAGGGDRRVRAFGARSARSRRSRQRQRRTLEERAERRRARRPRFPRRGYVPPPDLSNGPPLRVSSPALSVEPVDSSLSALGSVVRPRRGCRPSSCGGTRSRGVWPRGRRRGT